MYTKILLKQRRPGWMSSCEINRYKMHFFLNVSQLIRIFIYLRYFVEIYYNLISTSAIHGSNVRSRNIALGLFDRSSGHLQWTFHCCSFFLFFGPTGSISGRAVSGMCRNHRLDLKFRQNFRRKIGEKWRKIQRKLTIIGLNHLCHSQIGMKMFKAQKAQIQGKVVQPYTYCHT